MKGEKNMTYKIEKIIWTIGAILYFILAILSSWKLKDYFAFGFSLFCSIINLISLSRVIFNEKIEELERFADKQFEMIENISYILSIQSEIDKMNQEKNK